MRNRREQMALRRQRASAFTQRGLQASGGQFIEEHDRQDEVEAGVGERERLLRVELRILGAVDGERRLGSGELRLRLIADDQARWTLAREAPQHQRHEVAIPSA